MQSIYDIAEILAQVGVVNIVVCPGSRCAPLTISMARHPKLTVYTISDERSAGYIAMGMALQSGVPSVLVCTSGTASINFMPAVTEAYYLQIPLIVLTADRPSEWVDQQDGQTIRQNNLYQNHIKKSYILPQDYTHTDAQWAIPRIISEAHYTAMSSRQGPVHINIPLREPLYPKGEISYTPHIKIIKKIQPQFTIRSEDIENLKNQISKHKKVLVMIGFSKPKQWSQIALTMPVIADVLSNYPDRDNVIKNADWIVQKDQDDISPDLLITLGDAVLSKNIKHYFRKNKPTEHWHIQQAGEVSDALQSLTQYIQCDENYFIDQVLNPSGYSNTAYYSIWMNREKEVTHRKHRFLTDNISNSLTDIDAVSLIIKGLPKNSVLAVANSMSIRYISMMGIHHQVIHCNRGTSGIDGSLSTAVGVALKTDRPVVYLTGDMSFMYDRNALWNNYVPSNLKILVLNNGGGIIFKMIEGPSSQPEANEYFKTNQKFSVENTVRDLDANYYSVRAYSDLSPAIERAMGEEGCSVVEIFTDEVESVRRVKELKNCILTSN